LLAAGASAVGPGGWDHLGDGGAPGTPSLNGTVAAFNIDSPGVLLVGGPFTDAGGNPDADHIAAWNGTAWSAFGAVPLNGGVNAIAYKDGRVFAGGTFINAGGDQNADYLAVWDGTKWGPFCNAAGPPFGGGVASLQIIGQTLYVGGTFQNGAGIASADYLVACDLATGAARSPFAADGDGTGPVYALAADSNGTLYAAGSFTNQARIPAADYVASYDGTTWHAMGSGSGTGGGAVTGISRGLGASGTDVYLGTDATDVAGIPQADHVAKWDGSAWSAVGSNTAGSDGYFTGTVAINAITTSGSRVFAGGQFQDANGDPLADSIASFDGTAWQPVGSDGAGNGAINANVLALTVFGDQLYAGGGFTSAGGDSDAVGAASFSLTAGPAPLPPPVEGQTLNAVPEKGTVLVKLPAGATAKAHGAATGFVPLETVGRQLPVGTTLDTTKGTVLLSAATNASGGTQDGHISRGLFNFAQTKKNPLTTLSMTGGGLNACSKLPRGGSKKVRAAKTRRRTLFSNVKGRFRARGRNSTATVRGTSWTMTDTCSGTLTKVKTGSVTVRDFRLRKTRVVKAGHSYLARAVKKR
jgi:hypothetical protein